MQIESLFARWNTIEDGYFDELPRVYQKIRRERKVAFDLMVKVNANLEDKVNMVNSPFCNSVC